MCDVFSLDCSGRRPSFNVQRYVSEVRKPEAKSGVSQRSCWHRISTFHWEASAV